MTNSDPQPLSRAVSELIAMKGLARVRGSDHLHSAWKEIAGERIAGMTKVQGIRNGVLTVGVSNSGMLNELAGFHKQSLLEHFMRDLEPPKL